MVLMEYSGARGTLIYEKNLMSKISCQTPLKGTVSRDGLYINLCAANFSFAQFAKRKSLGSSKPPTNSQAQALQHTVWNVSTISKPY
jgi:hypothetical protein